MFKWQTPGAVDAQRTDSGNAGCLDMLPRQQQGQGADLALAEDKEGLDTRARREPKAGASARQRQTQGGRGGDSEG